VETEIGNELMAYWLRRKCLDCSHWTDWTHFVDSLYVRTM